MKNKNDLPLASGDTLIGLEAGFIDTLKGMFTLGRKEREYSDVKTFNTLSIRDIHISSNSVRKYLDKEGYINLRPLRLTKPVEIVKFYPDVLEAVAKVISITDKVFIELYVDEITILLSTLINNTSKLESKSTVSGIGKSRGSDYATAKTAHDINFNIYKDCLGGKGNVIGTYGDCYPNNQAFTGFGDVLRSHYREVTDFTIGRANNAMEKVYDLLNDLYTVILSDRKIKISKVVANQIEILVELMSDAGDLYVTASQQYRVLISSHNEHIEKMLAYSKK